MSQTVRIGISTCPNDTFAFHGLLCDHVDRQGLEIEIKLLDIQQLNDRLFAGEFDVAKCSFHAALLLADSHVVLPTGSALGFGVGPLLLASQPNSTPTSLDQVTFCPGQHTTATLLFRMFYPNSTAIEQVVFSEIMPGLQSGLADFGVCIHEGRFTWQDQGLFLVEDLGTRWEAETDCPLPLGGLVGSRSLPPDLLETVQKIVKSSLEYGLAHPEETQSTMRRYAQELDDEVLMEHVRLYVNDWTRDLGEVGRTALTALNRRAAEAGIIVNDARALQIFSGQ